MGVKVNPVPLIKEFPLFVAPTELFEVLKNEPFSFLLESQLSLGQLGRYSFLGLRPFLILKARFEEIEIDGELGYRKFKGNVWEVLRGYLGRFTRVHLPVFPPFIGGAVGYFSYDLSQSIENLPSYAADDLNLPHCYLCFYDAGIIFDHFRQKIYLISLGLPETNETKVQIKAETRLKELERYLLLAGSREVERDHVVNTTSQKSLIKANFTKPEYCGAVQAVRDYIRAGDVFQVNLSQRFASPQRVNSFELYKRLKRINPAPFAAYLNLGELQIISSSPERFLRLSGGKVQTRPIKGTRPRGKTPEKDYRLAQELLQSSKDKAEHIMIVDLERNDLGRVCEYGSVKVTDLMVLEPYSTVFHLVSTVEGELASQKGRIDLLRACFPGGSITGAPKVRAMEIIEELEPTKRTIYTGSIGYLSFNGQMDLNIAIRTLISWQENIYFQVGGGIVFDSDPQGEYEETLDKAKALISALDVRVG